MFNRYEINYLERNGFVVTGERAFRSGMFSIKKKNENQFTLVRVVHNLESHLNFSYLDICVNTVKKLERVYEQRCSTGN